MVRIEMGRRAGAMVLLMVWFYAAQCMGNPVSPHRPPTPTTPTTILTPAYYKSLMADVPAHCKGKTLYGYDALIKAAELASGFGTTGSDDMRKREVAAFLANVMHETGGLCYVKEINPSSIYCDRQSATQWPCKSEKRYYGRGPLMLTWNYNYGQAGRAIGADLLGHPELVSEKPLISFRTAFWFWMNKCHNPVVSGSGFASTISSINGSECGGRNPSAVKSRVNYYLEFCKQFGVIAGPNLYC